MLAIAAICLGPGGMGAASAWTAMQGDEITAALSDRKLVYPTTWQEFRASGRTLDNVGRDSWGFWRVTGDHSCSKWPPQDLWTCHDVTRKGKAFQVIGQAGDCTEATYAD